MTETILSKIREVLAKIEPPVARADDFNPADWSGGNFDDCYSMGIADGEARLAQDIREILQ